MVQVTGNHVEIASGTMCWSVDGVHLSRGFDTNENRGYDQCGYASNVIANTAHVNRQIVSDGKYETTDGEGILQQAAGGNDGLRNLWHANNLSGGSSGPVFYYKLFNTIDNIITVGIACVIITSQMQCTKLNKLLHGTLQLKATL